MRKLLRSIKLVALVVLVVALIALIAVNLLADTAVRVAVETAGTKALSVAVDLEGADLSITGGTLALRDLTVANPPGYQHETLLTLHQGLSKREALARAVEFLDLVRIPEPARRIREYPHQMSGGMRQRVMIAMALSCNPKILIADEPTTALDVTIQAQILKLMGDLKGSLNTAIIMITHDLGVIADMADRVMVMYTGLKVEEAPVNDLYGQPLHPYTIGLMASIPRVDSEPQDGETVRRLEEIPGVVPSLRKKIAGCTFAPRCKYATDHCRRVMPPLEEKVPGHWAACWEIERVLSDSN